MKSTIEVEGHKTFVKVVLEKFKNDTDEMFLDGNKTVIFAFCMALATFTFKSSFVGKTLFLKLCYWATMSVFFYGVFLIIFSTVVSLIVKKEEK